MEKVVYFVALCYSGDIFIPSIVEKFDNLIDAESYAALMSRTKKARYIVLEQQTEWDGTPWENK